MAKSLDEARTKLEDVVKEVRDGGVMGSGANGHRRALKDYEEIKQSQ